MTSETDRENVLKTGPSDLGLVAHTPGPWVDQADCRGDIFIVAGAWPHGSTIATVEATANAPANARLIASAPDLLDACKQATAILKDKGVPGWGVAKDILNAAIAKAEGK